MSTSRPGAAFIFALLVAAATALRAQEPPTEPGGVPVGFSVPVKRPLLVTIESSLSGTGRVTAGKRSQTLPIEDADRYVFVDEYTVLDKDREEATRFFVQQSKTSNADIEDGIFNGLEAKFTRAGEDRKVNLQGKRWAVGHDLRWLLKSFDSLGIWIGLPKAAKPGEPFKVDFAPLVPVLSTGDVECKSAECELKLVAHDEATGIARLEGKVAFRQEGERRGLAVVSVFAGSVTVVADPREGRIRELRLEGTSEMKGSGPSPAGPVELTGEGRVRAVLRTEIGPAAAEARKRKPVFRARPFAVHAIGVRLELPSYYSRLETEAPAFGLIRTIEADESPAEIRLDLVDGDPTKQNEFYKSLEAQLKQSHPDLKMKKVKAGIGDGRCYNLTSKEATGPVQVQSEVYPWRGKYLMYKLLGNPAAFKKAVKEFEKGRAGLKALN